MGELRYEYRVVDAEGEACLADVYTDEPVSHERCLDPEDALSCPAADVAANEARVYSNGGHPDCGPHRVQKRRIGPWLEADEDGRVVPLALFMEAREIIFELLRTENVSVNQFNASKVAAREFWHRTHVIQNDAVVDGSAPAVLMGEEE